MTSEAPSEPGPIEAAPTASAAEAELRKVAAQPHWYYIKIFAPLPFKIGAAAGALSWIIEGGVRWLLPGQLPGDALWPDPAPLVLGLLLGLLSGLGASFIVRFASGAMARGQATTTYGRYATNVATTSPAWWVKAGLAGTGWALLVIIAGLVALAWTWATKDGATALASFDKQAGPVLGFASASWLLGTLMQMAVNFFVDQILPVLERVLLKSNVGWLLRSVFEGQVTAVISFVVLALVTAAVSPLFEYAHLGPTIAFSGFATAGLMALWVGLFDGLDTWKKRHELRAMNVQPIDVEILGHPSNWDIPVETSFQREFDGMPWFLWRESADNRLGLSRPRWCRLAERDGALHFEFFDPSVNRRTTGALVIFCILGGLVTGGMLLAAVLDTTPRASYVFDTKPPPLLQLLGAILFGSIAGGFASGVTYFVVTLKRWYWGRFEDDGSISSRPLADLVGFAVKNAADLGAKFRGEPVKSGFGLIATFIDGTMWILTANAWEEPSIVRRHSALHNLFRAPRDELVGAVETRRRRERIVAMGGSATNNQPATGGIPDTL